MKKSLLACLVAASCSFAVTANDAVVKAEDLVGRIYGSINASRFHFDNERATEHADYATLDKSSGFGAAIGYRMSEAFEARFGYTDINFKQTSGATALDLLWFFREDSHTYLLGGANFFELQNDRMSYNVGIGRRHFFSENVAGFVEGKSYFNFSRDYVDWAGHVGFMYFFGESGGASSTDNSPEAPMAASTANRPEAVADTDSDNDGVTDANDQCANTPSSNKVDASGCTVFTEEMLKFELVVNFEHDSSVVAAKYFEEIKRLADFMNSYPQTEVVVAGHTSAPGKEAYNQGLSERRAQAVADVLTNNYGISSARIETVGYGETRLRIRGNTEAAHAENRRIEAEVSGTEKKAVQR